MDQLLSNLWQEILARPEGPLAMRFYLQPLMSMLFAMRDGVHDAQRGAPSFFWRLFTHPEDRRSLLRDAWHSVSKIFFLAVVLDVAYQLFVLGGLRPVEGLIIAVVLALVPYVLIRGPINRLVKAIRQVRHSH